MGQHSVAQAIHHPENCFLIPDSFCLFPETDPEDKSVGTRASESPQDI